MIDRVFSLNRSLSLLLLASFMFFVTPFPCLEIADSESAVTSSSNGMEYFPGKSAVRKQSPVTSGLRIAELFPIVFFLLAAWTQLIRRARMDVGVTYEPRIARSLTRLMLTPIKFTSTFV
ncbi:hypothetical protein ACFFSY_12185 [Paenibacillus aurantiacus]|uniref:Uncharacterized protein n=1 Tax=Paenibacillus aurantiacus TaxID=1936118 RepID=A0ABV5KNB2_9BACL